MTVLGLGFQKLVVERLGAAKDKVNIQSNANVTEVDKMEFDAAGKPQPALKFTFQFTTDYQPEIAKITIIGDVVWFDKPEEIEKLLKGWKKDKKIPKEVMTPVLNNILAKSNVEALVLSRELNLPPPIPLPKVEVKE